MTLFSHLYPQPPTPPKDADHHLVQDALQQADNFLDTSSLDNFDPVEVERIILPKEASYSALHTPPVSSPLPTTDVNNQIEGRSRKRLRFHDEPSFCEDLPVTEPPSNSEVVVKVKSILKSRDPHVVDEASPQEADEESKLPLQYTSLVDMLDSILQQLGSSATESRRDGYSVLVNALRAYSEYPEPEAILLRLPMFEEYLRRDISALDTCTDPRGSQLVTQALRLSAVFLWHKDISTSLTQDFLQFLVESSLRCLEKKDTPKEVVIHHMYFFTCQHLYKTAMTTKKMVNLIQLLSNIHEFNLGKNAQSIRIMVYHHLISLVPKIMLSTLDLWLANLFHGMFSNVQDVRAKAIEAGVDAGFRLGTSRRAGQAVARLFDGETADGLTYLDNVVKQMKRLLKRNEEGKCVDGQYVPRIWSIVILFLRASPQLSERWPHITQWLRLIQDCFNSTDQDLVIEAFKAWDRFIYSIHFTTNTRRSIIKALRQPITSNIQRKSSAKSRRVLDAALSTYATLLYYAFPPGESAEHSDLYWDEFVGGILNNMQHWNDVTAAFACRTLSTLFGGAQPRSRDADRMRLENEEILQPEELARFDCQWIRRNLDKVLKPVESLLRCESLWSAQQTDPPGAHVLWQSLLRAIREASSKEVTANIDVKNAVGAIVNILCRLEQIWSRDIGVQSVPAGTYLERLTHLCVTALEEIGPLQFTDPFLQATDRDSFEVFLTPSKQQHVPFRPRFRPVAILFRMFVKHAASNYASSQLFETLSRIVQTCLEAQKTRSSRLSLVKACADSIWTATETSDHRARFWGLLCKLATDILKETPLNTADHKTEKVGYEYRNVVRMLCDGLSLADHEHLQQGEELFHVLRHTVYAGTGPTAFLMSVTEPLLAAIEQNGHLNPDVSAAYATWILDKKFLVPEEKARSKARETMFDFWDLDVNGPIKSSGASFQSLCSVVEATLVRLCADKLSEGISRAFLVALQMFLNPDSCPFPALFLQGINRGLRLIPEDSTGRLLSDSHGISTLYSNTKQLWSAVLALIASLEPSGSNMLRHVETILIAGFCGKSTSIANATIETWNSKFGVEDDLRCSPHLVVLLRQLENITTIEIPLLYPTDGGQETSSPVKTHFLWKEDHPSPGPQAQHAMKHQHMSSPIPWSKTSRQASPLPRRASTPLRTPSKPSLYNTPPTRLRHDDSQIQFIPVDSSPLDVSDSQILTEHQKEVRSQQRAEMALFAELGSSPSVKIAKSKDHYLSTTPTTGKLRSPHLLAPVEFGAKGEDRTRTDHSVASSNRNYGPPPLLDGSSDQFNANEMSTTSSAVAHADINGEQPIVNARGTPAQSKTVHRESDVSTSHLINTEAVQRNYELQHRKQLVEPEASDDQVQSQPNFERKDLHTSPRGPENKQDDMEDTDYIDTLPVEREPFLSELQNREGITGDGTGHSNQGDSTAKGSDPNSDSSENTRADAQSLSADDWISTDSQGEIQTPEVKAITSEDMTITGTIKHMAQTRDLPQGITSTISFVSTSAGSTSEEEKSSSPKANRLEQSGQESISTEQIRTTRHLNSLSLSPRPKGRTDAMAVGHQPKRPDSQPDMNGCDESQESIDLSELESKASPDDDECITLQRPTADTPTFRELLKQHEQAKRRRSKGSRVIPSQSSSQPLATLGRGAPGKASSQKADNATAAHYNHHQKGARVSVDVTSSEEIIRDTEHHHHTRKASKRKAQGANDLIPRTGKRRKTESQSSASEDLVDSQNEDAEIRNQGAACNSSSSQASNKSATSSHSPLATRRKGAATNKRRFTRKSSVMDSQNSSQYEPDAMKEAGAKDVDPKSSSINYVHLDNDANSQAEQSSEHAPDATETAENNQSERATSNAFQTLMSPRKSQLQPLPETEQNTRLQSANATSSVDDANSAENDMDGTTLMEVDDVDNTAKAPTSPTSPRKRPPRLSSSNVDSSPFSPDGSPSVVLPPATSSDVPNAPVSILSMSQRARSVIEMIKDSFLPSLRDLALAGGESELERGELEDLGFAIMKEINAANRRQGV